MRIFKYELAFDDQLRAKVVAPRGARWLHATVQERKWVVWAQVQEDRDPVSYDFMAVSTGGNVPHGYDHLTTTLELRPFVWHIYVHWSPS